MKYLPTLLFILFFQFANSQNTIVTMNGIGDIKVGMKKAELEKIIGHQVKLVKLLRQDDWERDTLNFIHKDIAYQVIMDKNYNEEDPGFIVYEVKSMGKGLITRSGISIGDDKMKVINTYKDYTLQVMPDLEKDLIQKSKTRSVIWLFGEESGMVIIFYLKNDKVTGFSVMFNEGC